MAHVARGGELLRADRVLEARRELEQARAIRPGDPRILNLLGLTYFRLGMYPEASAIYRGLVAKSPRDASLRINLGLVHLKLGAVDEALVCLEEASALDPEHQRAAAYLGLALARKGEYRRARDAFIRAGQGELAREMQSHADRGTRQSGPHSGVADDDDLYPPIVVVEESAPTNGASSPVVSRRPQAVKTLTMPRFAEAPTRLPEHVGVRTPARGTVLPGDARYPAVPPMASAVPRPIAAEQTAPSPPPVVMERSAPMAAVRPVTVAVAPGPTAAVRPTLVAAAGPAGTARPTRPVAPPPAPAPRVAPLVAAPAPRVAPPPAPAPRVAPLVAAPAPSAAPHRTISAPAPTVPEPIIDYATARLVRPEASAATLEISGGALIVRVRGKAYTRTDGVVVSASGLTFEPALRRVRSVPVNEPFGEGAKLIYEVSGTGHLVAALSAGEFLALRLDGEALYVREDLVYAFDDSLRWENGTVPGGDDLLRVVQLRGQGCVALHVRKPPMSIKLVPGNVLYVDPSALAGWIGRVVPRVVTGEGDDSAMRFIECTGEGILLVEPPAASEA